jgi:hypothetical protein
MLGELHRESLARRSMETGEETIDDPLCDKLDPPERRERGGIEKVSARL